MSLPDTVLTSLPATSVANYTVTVPNTLSTITVPSPTYTRTITPQPQSAVTQVSTSTQIFTRWTQVDTSTATVVTPTCTTPLRPLHPDPICTVFLNKMQIPVGVPGVQRRAVTFGEAAPSPSPTSTTEGTGNVGVIPYCSTTSSSRYRVNNPNHTGPNPTHINYRLKNPPAPKTSTSTSSSKSTPNNPNHTNPALAKRAPDASAITVTSPADTTVTLLAAPSTQTNLVASTSTISVIDPAPQTVFAGQPVATVMAPVQPAETIVQTAYARAYETQTFGLAWTQTLTTTPSAALAECRAVGGNFGRWW